MSGWSGPDGALESLSPASGAVVLAAHAGAWERGVRELAKRGLRPLVVVAPWPHLPRTQRLVARLRARAGVKTVTRGFAGWRVAVEHLGQGSAVVFLIDSTLPGRRGRRALPFVAWSIAAPDAAVAWAARQGAALWVATAQEGGFHLQVLRCADGSMDAAQQDVNCPQRQLADRSVALLREAIERLPRAWAWVRPMAILCIALPFLLLSCAPLQSVPMLPTDPQQWTLEAEAVRWTGYLESSMQVTFSANRLRGSWLEGGAEGDFRGVRIVLAGESSEPQGEILAASAQGRWPEGPLQLNQVSWALTSSVSEKISEEFLSGSVPMLLWEGGAKLSCAGCVLEQLELGGPARGALRSD